MAPDTLNHAIEDYKSLHLWGTTKLNYQYCFKGYTTEGTKGNWNKSKSSGLNKHLWYKQVIKTNIKPPRKKHERDYITNEETATHNMQVKYIL